MTGGGAIGPRAAETLALFVRVVSKAARTQERFWSHVEQHDRVRCWMWRGPLRSEQYPVFVAACARRQVRRIMYLQRRGPIPAGTMLTPACRNRTCINPWHHEPVTNAQLGERTRRTVCRRGHPLTGRNVYTYRDEKRGIIARRCVTCHRTALYASRRAKRRRQLATALAADAPARGGGAAPGRGHGPAVRALASLAPGPP